ncbi:MAG TPA: LytTR family DNA-binding domain-containing protein [Woeseiaceae bacterium]|nr:LytTR family DNA-binding domain-containing protein [Woeseiaceae bacterium]
MKVLVVDDEQPARERLRQLLDDEDGYDCVGEAGNGLDAVTLCNQLQPDIVLLDIRMPGLDGIETAHHLNSQDQPPAIVFTTAYDEYAIDAFDARAVGYVLKPVRRKKLATALAQASRLAPSTLQAAASDARIESTRRHVCSRAHGELKLIPVADIYCFRADQKYVTVDHKNGQDLIDDSLKMLAQEFSGEFVRIHRSVLVAVSRIARIEKTGDGRSRVVLRDNSQVDDKELIISRRHLADVRRRLKGV